MQSLALLAPLVILFPSIGAFINFFWGARLGERYSATLGSVMAGLSFIVALALFSALNGTSYQAAIVNPPVLDGWLRIPSVGLEIPWQLRVDSLSVSMMLFVTFVGTLIHVYAAGYMHGDPRFPRFFAYLNMFLAFMLTLVSGNNFLMMFVGWEGVGLCSYLLIGFWWDKPAGEGWKNSNAARKAFIANRIGDFGVLMAIFLIFWTFGTLDFYKPTEVTNPDYVAGGAHAEEDAVHSEGGIGEEGAESEGEGEATPEADHDASSIVLITEETHSEAAPAAEEGTEGEAHSEETGVDGEAHGEEAAHGEAVTIYTNNDHLAFAQLGVFGQTQVLTHLEEGETVDTGIPNAEPRGRLVNFGTFQLDIDTVLVLITLFMLLGAAGKSAQIPLFVWLPDAMAGPTPVSALIHAATMVTAGVYMMVRANVFFYHAEFTSVIVTLVGISTALVAGFIAIGQFDIKRVLAYSTISQLGFMVAAVGIGAYIPAMFHMITHAFFKALLFLGSGSVIHGMEHGHHHAAHGHGHGHNAHGADPHGEVHGYDAGHLGDHKPEVTHDEHAAPFDPQDMRNMGGLRYRMPITFWTYLIGTLALAGIWPLAGFWSKDEILADSWLAGIGADSVAASIMGYIALGALLLAAGFTAFYMWRQLELVFFGKPRTEAAEYASESVPSMTIPLVVLAFFSVFIGFVNLPSGQFSDLFALGTKGVFGSHSLANFLSYSIDQAHIGEFQWWIALTALAVGLGAIFFARSRYGSNHALNEQGEDPLYANRATRPIWQLANARMYWDEIYAALFIVPFQRTARFLADTLDWKFWHNYFHDTVIWRGFNAIGELLSQPFDLGIIDGVVNGIGRLVRGSSSIMRRSQTGYVRVYAVVLLLGVVAVVLLMLLPILQG